MRYRNSSETSSCHREIRRRGMNLLCLLGLMVVLAASGCQSTRSFSFPNLFANGKDGNRDAQESSTGKRVDEEIEYQQPAKMAVIWKESAIAPPGGPSTRGFGGRVYFYNEKNESIRVDGQLAVYAFDDSNSDSQQSRVPDRKYVFESSDLQNRHSETNLGSSYSIWLPWDKVGGARKTIALVPVFKPREGYVPRTDHSIAVLSGPTPQLKANERIAEANRNHVRQVSMTVPENLTALEASRLGVTAEAMENAQSRSVRTTTIELTKSLSNRMKLAPRQSSQKTFDGSKGNSGSSVSDTNSKSRPATTAGSNASTRTARSTDGDGEVREKSGQVFGQPGSFR